MDAATIQIGRRVAQVRKARHLTQAQVAPRLGITKRQFQNIELGTSQISAQRVLELADVLDCHVDVLVEPPGARVPGRRRPAHGQWKAVRMRPDEVAQHPAEPNPHDGASHHEGYQQVYIPPR